MTKKNYDKLLQVITEELLKKKQGTITIDKCIVIKLSRGEQLSDEEVIKWAKQILTKDKLELISLLLDFQIE